MTVQHSTFPKLMSQCFERRQYEESLERSKRLSAACDQESCFLTTAVQNDEAI